jgi:quercetin dioxygenase-like cupin family protein
MGESSACKLYNWNSLPATELMGGVMRRTAHRSDNCLLTFNRIQPQMKRWEPHHHPFDQIVLTLAGRQMLEVDGEVFECPAGSITRVPANAMHTGWPEGDEPVMNIDVFPLRPDYLFLTAYQEDYPQPEPGHPVYHQIRSEKPFTGKVKADTTGILYRWTDLPRVQVIEGMERAAFRGDDALVVFNFITPEMKRTEPHQHPFDQIVLTVTGRMMLEIEGEIFECGPGSLVRVPRDAKHTGWALGDEPILNVDIFSPPRQDYLYLTKYQTEFQALA